MRKRAMSSAQSIAGQGANIVRIAHAVASTQRRATTLKVRNLCVKTLRSDVKETCEADLIGHLRTRCAFASR
jgi:hypothetical protein